jgi:hypothetical protein
VAPSRDQKETFRATEHSTVAMSKERTGHLKSQASASLSMKH